MKKQKKSPMKKKSLVKKNTTKTRINPKGCLKVGDELRFKFIVGYRWGTEQKVIKLSKLKKFLSKKEISDLLNHDSSDYTLNETIGYWSKGSSQKKNNTFLSTNLTLKVKPSDIKKISFKPFIKNTKNKVEGDVNAVEFTIHTKLYLHTHHDIGDNTPFNLKQFFYALKYCCNHGFYAGGWLTFGSLSKVNDGIGELDVADIVVI